MLTVKKLATVLKSIPGAEGIKSFGEGKPVGPDENLVESLRGSCEAYGKTVKCYLIVKDDKLRGEVVSHLRGLTPVSTSWNSNVGGIEVGVSYFKAWHWDE
jgi:hypothetical protein